MLEQRQCSPSDNFFVPKMLDSDVEGWLADVSYSFISIRFVKPKHVVTQQERNNNHSFLYILNSRRGCGYSASA